MPYCSECGIQLNGTPKFCSNCGARNGVANISSAPNQQTSWADFMQRIGTITTKDEETANEINAMLAKAEATRHYNDFLNLAIALGALTANGEIARNRNAEIACWEFAILYATPLASAGDSEAQYWLSHAYREVGNLSLAEQYLIMAADNGNQDARNLLDKAKYMR